jgi:hypothetical protein
MNNNEILYKLFKYLEKLASTTDIDKRNTYNNKIIIYYKLLKNKNNLIYYVI